MISYLILAFLAGVLVARAWDYFFAAAGRHRKEKMFEKWDSVGKPYQVSSAEIIALKEKLNKQYSGTVPLSEWLKPWANPCAYTKDESITNRKENA